MLKTQTFKGGNILVFHLYFLFLVFYFLFPSNARLALPLFMSWIFTNNIEPSSATDDFTLSTSLFNRGSDFHVKIYKLLNQNIFDI